MSEPKQIQTQFDFAKTTRAIKQQSTYNKNKAKDITQAGTASTIPEIPYRTRKMIYKLNSILRFLKTHTAPKNIALYYTKHTPA
jgi:hypothetical protein